jgi:hypothetical protein
MRGLKGNEVEAVFDQLEALGWIAREPGSRPGRRADRYAVNPRVHTEFAERAAAEAERRLKDQKMLAAVFGKQAA